MKNVFVKLVFVSLLFLGFLHVNSANAYVSVSGYMRSNGTYVAPHYRTSPNAIKYDNISWKPSQGLYNTSYTSYTPSYTSYTPSYTSYTPSYTSYTPSYRRSSPTYESLGYDRLMNRTRY